MQVVYCILIQVTLLTMVLFGVLARTEVKKMEHVLQKSPFKFLDNKSGRRLQINEY